MNAPEQRLARGWALLLALLGAMLGLTACARCPATEVDCSGLCANLRTDPANCGKCGRACTAPLNGVPHCSSALCDFECRNGFVRCGAECVSTCEACAGSPLVCNGACVSACANCRGATTPCAGRCVSLLTDPSSCGACGAACRPGDACQDARCVCLPSCGGVECGPDPRCGQSCGACATPYFCGQSGRCQEQCGAQTCLNPARCCQNACANVSSDPLNCGSCGNQCPQTHTCLQGLCCQRGFAHCGNACVDPTSDSLNCGQCGATCKSPAACCNSLCTDFSRDPLNCGGCGRPCPTAAPICNGGICSSR